MNVRCGWCFALLLWSTSLSGQADGTNRKGSPVKGFGTDARGGKSGGKEGGRDSNEAKPDFVVDWRDKRSDQLHELRAGQQIRIRIEDLAPLCYSYTIKINQVPWLEQASFSVAGILQGDVDLPKELTIGGKSADTVAAANAKAAVSATGSAVDRIRGDAAANSPYHTLFQKGKKTLAPGTFGNVLQRLVGVDRKISESIAAFGAARAATEKLLKARAAATKAIAAFVKGACQQGERGSLHGEATSSWTSSLEVINAFAESADFSTMSTSLERSIELAAAADSLLGCVLAEDDLAFRLYLESKDGALTIQRYLMLLSQLRSQVKSQLSDVVTTLKKDRAATQAAVKSLNELAAMPDHWEQPRFLVATTDKIEVSITATGRTLPNDVTPPTTTETYSAPVRRRARVSNSVGVAFTTLAGLDYARVNLPRFRAGGDSMAIKDSTYSTFVDRDGSRGVAAAPFLLTHVTLFDVHEYSFALSGGVGARSVHGQSGPEYLMGLSTSVGEQVFITLAWHRGRRERLLLGDPATVSRRAVPTSITDDSAIGIGWASAFAAVISWKIGGGKQ